MTSNFGETILDDRKGTIEYYGSWSDGFYSPILNGPIYNNYRVRFHHWLIQSSELFIFPQLFHKLRRIVICHPCERARLCKLDTTESLLLLQGTGLGLYTAGWLLLSGELSLNAQYSFSDVHSLEWSNLHLSDRFKWKDNASVKLHRFHSLVKVSRILDDSC